MNDATGELNSEAVAQTNANLRLASQFIRELLANPDQREPIPLGASVILLPPPEVDEPELRQANLEMARKLTEQGHEVIFWTVGMETAESQAIGAEVKRKRA